MQWRMRDAYTYEAEFDAEWSSTAQCLCAMAAADIGDWSSLEAFVQQHVKPGSLQTVQLRRPFTVVFYFRRASGEWVRHAPDVAPGA